LPWSPPIAQVENLVVGDRVENKVAQARGYDDACALLVGFSSLKRIVGKTACTLDQARDQLLGCVGAIFTDVGMNTNEIALRGTGKPNPHAR
jgi:hypothetical protein